MAQVMDGGCKKKKRQKELLYMLYYKAKSKCSFYIASS